MWHFARPDCGFRRAARVANRAPLLHACNTQRMIAAKSRQRSCSSLVIRNWGAQDHFGQLRKAGGLPADDGATMSESIHAPARAPVPIILSLRVGHLLTGFREL